MFRIAKQILREQEFKKREETGLLKEYWETYHYVDHQAMIDELSKKTKLPKFVCELVYTAEESILEDLGIIK